MSTVGALDTYIDIQGYRIDGVLGRGGFGTVYSALRHGDGQRVAIKVARTDRHLACRRLEEEAAALRRIGPPHTPALLSTGKLASGAAFLVMEYIVLPTLASELRAGPLTLDTFGARADAILAAVGVAHARGFVHRDLKPSNVLIGGLPVCARLIDFGGASLGTAEYMAPEQWREGARLDARTDLYAMGVMFFEMLAGHPPFRGALAEIKQAHLERRPLHLAAPPVIEQVVLRCLAKDPSDRPASARSVRKLLREALGRAEVVSHEPVAPRPTAPPVERHAVAILNIECAADAATVQEVVSAFGGQLDRVVGRRHVAVFSPERSENPVRQAWRAARRMAEVDPAGRALVDVAPVVVHRRGNHALRAVSLVSETRLPTDCAVLLTPEAASVVPELAASANRPLIGRHDELQALIDDARNAAESRTTSATTVLGEAGYGKSHLCAVLLERLHALEPRIEVIHLRATEPVAGEIDPTMQTLLGRIFSLPIEPPPDRGRSHVAKLLGEKLADELWPAVALWSGWLQAEDPVIRASAAAPGALRSAAARAAALGLQSLAARGPLALVVDDAQFADDIVHDVIALAGRGGVAVPLWMCVLARTTLAPRVGRCITLGPLDGDSAASLCRHLLRPADEVPAQVIEQLVARTRAIPLLMVELVRGLSREGLVRRRRHSESYYVATEILERLPDLPPVAWLADRDRKSVV